MKDLEIKDLKAEISHIFESGANEIRILEMVKLFVSKRYIPIMEQPAYEPCILLQKVETLDCIKEGDQLVLESESEIIETVTVRKIKHSKSDGTEVIFDIKNNRYFNLGMYLKGESWVARVYVIKSK